MIYKYKFNYCTLRKRNNNNNSLIIIFWKYLFYEDFLFFYIIIPKHKQYQEKSLMVDKSIKHKKLYS
jgi:hypothetical protein